ncbi:nitrate/nitrite transporter [Paracoccus marcusii]|uniref:MFS transporter n=1 Tax=Paracoccus marcusii TaxID=59779 RepID=UPI0039C858A6
MGRQGAIPGAAIRAAEKSAGLALFALLLFVFGAFVALALWLPHYLIDVYGIDVRYAGMAAASFSLSASLFRAYGGILSDRFGARSVMYWTFSFSMLFLLMLSYPPTDYVIQGKDGPIAFSTSMGFGPSSPHSCAWLLREPRQGGRVQAYPCLLSQPCRCGRGLVGMIGGLGGFALPIAFGVLLDLTGIYTSCFALLFVLVTIALTWMHFSVRAMERSAHGEALDGLPQLPEMRAIHHPERTAMPRVLDDWRPEDSEFWATQGRAVARRNLWISIPRCFWPFRSGWSGRWSSHAFLPSALPLHRNSCSGWQPCLPCRARHCASSMASWCRSLAGDCGPRWPPRRCCCRPSVSAMPFRTRKPLCHVPGTGASVRAGRGELCLVYGQYRLFLSQG